MASAKTTKIVNVASDDTTRFVEEAAVGITDKILKATTNPVDELMDQFYKIAEPEDISINEFVDLKDNLTVNLNRQKNPNIDYVVNLNDGLRHKGNPQEFVVVQMPEPVVENTVGNKIKDFATNTFTSYVKETAAGEIARNLLEKAGAEYVLTKIEQGIVGDLTGAMPNIPGAATLAHATAATVVDGLRPGITLAVGNFISDVGSQVPAFVGNTYNMVTQRDTEACKNFVSHLVGAGVNIYGRDVINHAVLNGVSSYASNCVGGILGGPVGYLASAAVGTALERTGVVKYAASKGAECVTSYAFSFANKVYNVAKNACAHATAARAA